MKVLFLDIDGVVNSYNTQERFMGFLGIQPDLADLIKEIIEKTGCKVVLSSTWRSDKATRNHVKLKVCDFIDITPKSDRRGFRGDEIRRWLALHPEVTKYCVLDDNSDFHMEQKLFQTSMTRGITRETADAVIEYLGAA